MKKHVKGGVAAPTDADYSAAINQDYVKPDYTGFNPANHTANKLASVSGADWYKTAFGTLGGASKVKDYSFSYAENKFTVKAGEGSKFAATQDGTGAIFVQIDESKNFTATAKAKVTASASSASDQIAFGMMLRDDIYIDTNITTVASNFVSASVTGKGKANMSRIVNTSLGYGGAMPFTLNAEYELTVKRVGQVVDVTVKQGANSVTTKFTDISFVGVDNTKIYLCLFANRGLTVEFSEVSFAITGEAQGA